LTAHQPDVHPAPPHVVSRRWTTWALDALLALCLVALALGVRWPHLFDSPAFPPVSRTVLAALAVLDGQLLPLADQAPYLGAPFVYILVAAYWLVGPSVELTWVVAWLIGGVGVIPVYYLGRELAGRVAGVIAALLLATSPAHTVITSHVAWVHSLTPLFASISLYFLARALMRRERRALVIGGVAIGLSLQTHPTVLPLLAGAAAAVVCMSRGSSPARAAAILGICTLIGYAPLLGHHVQTKFEVISDIEGKRARYLDDDADAGEHDERGIYLNNLELLAGSLLRLSSGALMDDKTDALSRARDPMRLVYPLVAVAGIYLVPTRARWLLASALLPAILLPPLLNGKYRPILDGRYLMPMVPVLFVCIGCAGAWIIHSGIRRSSRIAAATCVVLVTSALVVQPLAALERFYEDTTEDGVSNANYLATLATLRANLQPTERVWVDPHLRDIKMPGGASVGSTFSWILPVSRIDGQLLAQPLRPAELIGDVALLHRDTAASLRRVVQLTQLDSAVSRKARPAYAVYRVTPLES
jgi:hypothetical protein